MKGYCLNEMGKNKGKMCTLSDRELGGIAIDERECCFSGFTEGVASETDHDVRVRVNEANEIFEEAEAAQAASHAEIRSAVRVQVLLHFFVDQFYHQFNHFYDG